MTATAPSAETVRAGGAVVPDLANAILRANPAYELVPLERLSGDERALLAELADDELYGLLLPRERSRLAPRSASSDLALLFLTLRDPGPVPAFVGHRLGGTAEETLARLVLDGVLEIEREGAFLSGTPALGPRRRSSGRETRVGALSLAALRHVEALEGVPAELLALRLYCFGRRPLTPRLQAELPDEAAVARFLGVERRALRDFWVESGTRSGDPWRMWRRRGRAAHGSRTSASFKLYIAPTLEAAPGALVTAAEVLARLESCHGLKVARNAPGLCRPDKLVAYFGRLEDLHAAAASLQQRLDCPTPQPVPFSASIDTAGLLSWGVDPAEPRDGGRSWRLWLVNRLATYLVEGRESGADPTEFALARIGLDGIDVDSWAPVSSAWNGDR
jgi:hypothetical protein